jgi:hypothetical protein
MIPSYLAFFSSGFGSSLAAGAAAGLAPASFAAASLGAPAFAGSPAFLGAAVLPQPTAQNMPRLKITTKATNFFMGSPSSKTFWLIGYLQQETILPAVKLDTDHWAIIPHKVQ